MNHLEEYQNKTQELLSAQRSFFNSGKTKDIHFRIKSLKRLLAIIVRDTTLISKALYLDLHKSEQESYLTEIGTVISEIKCHIRNLKLWSKPKKVRTPLFMWPSRSYIMSEPLGVTLILSPWNYPFLLLMDPLIGAISAGNCTILKPSHQCSNINRVIQNIITEAFPSNHVVLIEGDPEQTQRLLQLQFDFIFFTGSSSFGKTVMKAAAEHLTPLVLELGGKSPCIVDSDADVDIAARRIVWGKLINTGQTCIAPDYLLVHKDIAEKLTANIKKYITQFYGENPIESPYYPQMVNDSAFQRVISYFNDGDILIGGKDNKENRSIAPTLLGNVSPTSAVMQTEIFGPVLPMLLFTEISEAIHIVNNKEKPLALYYFGSETNGKHILQNTTSGGACINDVLMHIANRNLPFGGVGFSGMGKYHGIESFNVFSNKRAVVYSSTKIDFPMKYVPFKGFKWIKRLL